MVKSYGGKGRFNVNDKRKTGRILGIGVGPGDPELLTLKAIRCIKEADIVCLPRKNKEECRAYRIAVQAVPELAEKEIIGFEFEMTADPKKLKELHCGIYEQVKPLAEEGRTAAFLTIGDPAVYSTVGYILELAAADGIETEIVSGITSFCAAAAACGRVISEGGEDIHILAGFSPEKMELPGTKVIMKTGRRGDEMKKYLTDLENRSGVKVFGASDCGLADERIYRGAAELPDDGRYMITLIVKD